MKPKQQPIHVPLDEQRRSQLRAQLHREIEKLNVHLQQAKNADHDLDFDMIQSCKELIACREQMLKAISVGAPR